MMKSTAFILAATTLLSPIALADSETFEIDIVYDIDLLETEEGAEQVLASIVEQAEDACTHRYLFTYAPSVDRACVDMIVTSAKTEIYSSQVDAGRPAPDLFADASVMTETLTVQR